MNHAFLNSAKLVAAGMCGVLDAMHGHNLLMLTDASLSLRKFALLDAVWDMACSRCGGACAIAAALELRRNNSCSCRCMAPLGAFD